MKHHFEESKSKDGCAVGTLLVGLGLGADEVGVSVGDADGSDDLCDTFVGTSDGTLVGSLVGNKVGISDG